MTAQTFPSLHRPKAILFDLDDTILTYNAAGQQAWRAVCEKYAAVINGGNAPALHEEIRAQSNWFWSDPQRDREGRRHMITARTIIITAVLQAHGCTDIELAATMAHLMTQRQLEYIQAYPGAIDMLHHLHAAGIKLGMVTNGDSTLQHRKIDQFHLRPLFSSILIEGDFGIGKPDPRAFTHVLDELRLDPDEAWMVGDRLDCDIAPARKLGIYTVWHDYRKNGLPENVDTPPHRIITSPAELTEGIM